MTTLNSYENYLFSHLERAAEKMKLKESDKQDTVTLDVPLLIRLLELAREDIKSDPELHRVVDRMLTLKNTGVLTMYNYDFIINNESDNPEKNTSQIQTASDDLGDIRKLAGL